MHLRSRVKRVFQITNSLPLLDKLLFHCSRIANRQRNRVFKKSNKEFKLPPDYYLYETYKLNYREYKEDGLIAAKEIIEWTEKYGPTTKTILEWGCGVARVVRHLSRLVSEDSTIYACDINTEMITWNKLNIDHVNFDLISYSPPTPYKDNSFDLIYALSVFTHIESNLQPAWIKEMARIIKPGGIFLFTTHGTMYFNQLGKKQLKYVQTNGSHTIAYLQKGHRMMTTYNAYEVFKTEIEKYFEVLEYYPGIENVHKAGGQDLWIVKKK